MLFVVARAAAHSGVALNRIRFRVSSQKRITECRRPTVFEIGFRDILFREDTERRRSTINPIFPIGFRGILNISRVEELLPLR